MCVLMIKTKLNHSEVENFLNKLLNLEVVKLFFLSNFLCIILKTLFSHLITKLRFLLTMFIVNKFIKLFRVNFFLN